MGLLIQSEDDKRTLFSGSYSSFAKLRRKIAKMLGLDPVIVYYGTYTEAKSQLAWKDGMEIFFYHSDADGVWTAEECSQMLKFLKKIKNNVKVDQLVAGIEYCAKKKQFVIFG